MPNLFAHSEQQVKRNGRYLRRDKDNGERYNATMKLKITELRKKRGLTVQALADAAGISKSYLSEIANGVKEANGRRLDAIANALDCSPIDLIDDASIDAELLSHIKRMQSLPPADRLAVMRHADGLAPADDIDD